MTVKGDMVFRICWDRMLKSWCFNGGYDDSVHFRSCSLVQPYISRIQTYLGCGLVHAQFIHVRDGFNAEPSDRQGCIMMYIYINIVLCLHIELLQGSLGCAQFAFLLSTVPKRMTLLIWTSRSHTQKHKSSRPV